MFHDNEKQLSIDFESVKPFDEFYFLSDKSEERELEK